MGVDRRRWKMIRSFENGWKTRFLRGLTDAKSLAIFSDLYQFAQRLTKRDHHRKLNMPKIQNIMKINSLFAKTKP